MKELYFENVTGIGNLYLDYVFYEFEKEPILFVCADTEGTLYFCYCTEIRYEQKWLIVKVTTAILKELVEEEKGILEFIQSASKVIIITMDTRGCEASVDVRAADIDPLDLPQPGTFVRCNKELARNYLWGKDFLKIAMQLGTSIAKTINSMTDNFVQSFSVQLTTILQENKKSIHSTILGELSSDYEYVVKEKDMYPDKTEQINYNKNDDFSKAA